MFKFLTAALFILCTHQTLAAQEDPCQSQLAPVVKIQLANLTIEIREDNRLFVNGRFLDQNRKSTRRRESKIVAVAVENNGETVVAVDAAPWGRSFEVYWFGPSIEGHHLIQTMRLQPFDYGRRLGLVWPVSPTKILVLFNEYKTQALWQFERRESLRWLRGDTTAELVADSIHPVPLIEDVVATSAFYDLRRLRESGAFGPRAPVVRIVEKPREFEVWVRPEQNVY